MKKYQQLHIKKIIFMILQKLNIMTITGLKKRLKPNRKASFK